MDIVYFVTLNALAHLAFVGARMTTSLFALQLGASELTVGVLMSLFAFLPMLLSIGTGRLIDRMGPRRPLGLGFALFIVGTLVPFAFPTLLALYFSSTLLGVAFMLAHIGMNSVIGAHGTPARRPLNFSWLALGFSISGSAGPLVAGFAIDWLGPSEAFAALAVFPAFGLAMLWLRKAPLPRPERGPAPPGERGVLGLLRVPGLRKVFIVSGLMAMGWDLYAFLIPIYGSRLGLAAGTIGSIMASFSIATFAVRLVLPMIVGKVRHGSLIAAALGIAGAAYSLFPFVASVPLLAALSFFLGLGLGSAQPAIMSLLYEASPPGRQGEAVGVRTTMINTSQTGMPLASGALSASIGMGPVFWGLAALLLGGAWFARRRIR